MTDDWQSQSLLELQRIAQELEKELREKDSTIRALRKELNALKNKPGEQESGPPRGRTEQLEILRPLRSTP